MLNSPTDLRDLPRRSGETWQLVVLPLSGMRVRADGKLIEPIACFIVEVRTRLAISVQIGEPGRPEHELACAAMVAGCLKREIRYVPGTLQVRDPELAALIRPALASARGMQVELVESLSAVDELVEDFMRDMVPPPSPGWLDAPDMTLSRLTGFAEAAAMMFKAAPWQHLANEDLIQIESPRPPVEAMRCASVMGAGGDAFGLSFFSSRQEFDGLIRRDEPEKITARDSMIGMTFNDAEDLPPGDAELWLTEQLPLARENAHPLLMRYPGKGGFERLDGSAVTFVEGLCRALAQTTEEQIDSGRWELPVQTSEDEGQVTYVLSIPSLIDAMRGIKPKSSPAMFDRRTSDAAMLAIELLMDQRRARSVDEMNAILARELRGKVPQLPPPSTPLDRAQWLCFEAFEYRGRRRIQLARQALQICPDVADAYCLLAEQRAFDPVAANDLFRQGVEAGRRALGEGPFNDPEFRFWGHIRSRPYMRARQGFAETLRALGRKKEAADEFMAMLVLNPNDNQGVRYQLAPLLLEQNRLDELDALLSGDDFRDDASAEWAYVRALLAYRRAADSPNARSELRGAIDCNPHVPKYLLGRTPLPPSPPPLYSPGDEREAIIVASSQKALWEQTPNSLDWLGKCKRQVNQAAKQKKRRRKR